MQKRIQRKRVKGWRMPGNTVYVGRPSKWGNPHNPNDYKFKSADQNRHAAVRDYKDDFYSGRLGITAKEVKRELAGKNLACFCALDTYCHGDFLLDLANT